MPYHVHQHFSANLSTLDSPQLSSLCEKRALRWFVIFLTFLLVLLFPQHRDQARSRLPHAPRHRRRRCEFPNSASYRSCCTQHLKRPSSSYENQRKETLWCWSWPLLWVIFWMHVSAEHHAWKCVSSPNDFTRTVATPTR
jgi:hypothetical protein